jgi:hypothetical protein
MSKQYFYRNNHSFLINVNLVELLNQLTNILLKKKKRGNLKLYKKHLFNYIYEQINVI